MKKKDQLLQIINLNEQLSLLEFLDMKSMFELSLLNKKYNLTMQKNLVISQLDRDKDLTKQTKQKKKDKNRKKETQAVKDDSVQVQIQKVSMSKWFTKHLNKDLQSLSKWKKLQQLPLKNSYLQSKLQNRTDLFYQHQQTKELMFINRTMVDPTLDLNQSPDVITENIYEDVFEEAALVECDFASQEALLQRQKQILMKLNVKKHQQQEKETINYQQHMKKAIMMKRFAIVLCFGGSFSIAVYEGDKCILHKSDKKYVCRKKAGERQLNRDKQSGSSIQSMGSQIRRDQEKKHMINVNAILMENRSYLEECELIIMQAPGLNRLFVINENQTLKGLQDRLRSACLTAKKANYTEVEGVWERITKVNLVKVK